MKRYGMLSAAGIVVATAIIWAVMATIWGIGAIPGLSPGWTQTRVLPAQAANPCNPCRPNQASAANPCNPCQVRPGSVASTRAANPCNPDQAGGSGAGVAAAAQGATLSWGAGYRSYARATGYGLSAPHGNRMVATYVSSRSALEVFRHNAQLAQQNRAGGYRNFPEGTVLVLESFTKTVPPTAGAASETRKPSDARAALTAGNPGALPRKAGNPCAPQGRAANPCALPAKAANPCAVPGKAGNPCAVPGKAGNPCNPDTAALRPAAPAGPTDASGSRPGPVFFMKKEPAGYDRDGGDWRYAATDSALNVTIGDGQSGPVQFCKDCHAAAQNRGFVYATGRP